MKEYQYLIGKIIVAMAIIVAAIIIACRLLVELEKVSVVAYCN